MIISKEKMERIRRFIEMNFNAFIFKTVGEEALSLEEIKALLDAGLIEMGDLNGIIREAYYIGRARNVIDPREREEISLAEFARKHRSKAIPITDVEKYAIEHVVASAGNHITSLGSKIQSAVDHIISTNNLEYRNAILTEQVRPVLVEGIEQDKTIMKIAADLRDKTGDMFRDWKRVSSTEVSTAMNLGEADAIVERNKGKKSEEIYVYKRVNKDAATCVHCKKAYLRDDQVTPKVFKLSELQANGTNYGLKASEYKPTITPLHPNCRCALVEIPNGWTFEEDTGKMIYKNPDWIEYKNQ